ncbi:hypothetical protein VNI00_009202 [Paramarasmius palmivorus]|uniref:BTB domain-containing protein n=1 Tax=Paramarasmius palmivorus TaxID=297713 RepID=A0AAW0CNV6_9AGAR
MNAQHTKQYVCDAIANCMIPVDIVLEASDGQLLGAHTKNLENFNHAFPCRDSVTHELQETVKLTEDSDTLRLLLKFSHNEDYGDVESFGLDRVLALLEAAKKYGNYIALYACKVAMNRLARKNDANALRVIPYKVMHNDYHEMDAIVLATMGIPLDQVIISMRKFPEVYIIYALVRHKRSNNRAHSWVLCQKELAA